MRVIITGANGFIGSTLTNFFLSKNIEVLAIDLVFDKNKFKNNKLLHFLKLSLDDLNSYDCTKLVNKYDVFYHLAWQGVNGEFKRNPYIQIKNIERSIKCIDFAKKIHINKILFSGSISENNVFFLPKISKTNATMMYSVSKYSSKLFVETYCKQIGINFVWMCFSNVYGCNNLTGNLISYTLNELLNNREATFGPCKTYYDFIYIDDLIYAIYLLGIKNLKKEYYFIGSGQPKLLKDYLFEIGKTLKKEKLLKFDVRPDDNIIYRKENFDISQLVNDIGQYAKKDFAYNLRKIIKNIKH